MTVPVPSTNPLWRSSWARIQRNPSGQVRVGWKLLAFVIILNAIGFSLDFGMRRLNGGAFPTFPVNITSVLIALLPTWLLLRLEKRPFSDLGLRLNGRWFRDLGLGFLLACGLMAVASSGVAFVQDGWVRNSQPVGVLLRGMGFYLGGAVFEELVFRGYPFQRMVEGWGVKLTQGLMALFFVLPHLLAGLLHGYPVPSMIGASLNIACAALFLGFAFLRTGSLALPIGIHWGWNWMQGTVLGLRVSGATATTSFFTPAHPGPKVSWITGGLYGPEASIIGTIAVLVGIVIIWKAWRPNPSTQVESVQLPESNQNHRY